jgi:hypothetical protein
MGKVETEKIEISRDEWIAIGTITGFAFFWMLLIIPHLMVSNWFIKLIPPLQYVLYNIGFMLLIFIVFGTPMSALIKHKINKVGVIKGGVASTLFLIMLDLWEPPFLIAPDTGQLLLTNLESLVGTSVDYTAFWIYSNLFPMIINSFINFPFFGRLSMLFVLIYFLTPIILAFIMALLLKPGMFRKLWDGVAERF